MSKQDQVAAPVAAPSAQDERITAAISEWFATYVQHSAVSQFTEAYSHLQVAKPALIASVLAATVTKE